MSLTRPSPHFTWEEFACRDEDKTEYPEEWRVTRAVPLAIEAERVRLHIGAFRPSSVYRTRAYHESLYRRMRPPQQAPLGSQHLTGRAMDIPQPEGMTWQEFELAILRVAREDDSAIRYVKFYRSQHFAHIDIRPTKRLVIEGATFQRGT